MDEKLLLQKSKQVMNNSYSPYSGFRVGAAVLAGSGKIYTGTNIENVSFGATCCAERVAVFNAVSNGEKKIMAIAISSDSNDYIMPCGICRQVLAEFGDNNMDIFANRNDGDFKIFSLSELLPSAFRSIKQ